MLFFMKSFVLETSSYLMFSIDCKIVFIIQIPEIKISYYYFSNIFFYKAYLFPYNLVFVYNFNI